MFRTTIKGLLAHKVRLALTAVSVILGVAFMSGTYVLTDTLKASFTNLFHDISADKDVIVRSQSKFGGDDPFNTDRAPIAASVLQTVRGVDGVAAASGDITRDGVVIIDRAGKPITHQGPPSLGTNWVDDPKLSSLTLRSGHAPTKGDEVAIDAKTVKDAGFSLGDTVTIQFPSTPKQTFTLVGITGFGKADNLAGATMAAFDEATADTLLQADGAFDQISVSATSGVSATELRDRIQRAVPQGTEVVTAASDADASAAAISKGFDVFGTALTAFALIALFVGAFIIYNTFGILVTQRTRELALLRALGASRSQVTWSVVAEAAIVGVLASAAGLFAGLGVASGLQALLKAGGLDLPSTSLQFLPRTIVVSMVAGSIVTAFAAIAPAVRASRVPPVSAMADGAVVTARGFAKRTMGGAIVTALGAAGMAGGLLGGPLALLGLGVMFVFVGMAMLSPVITAPLSRWLGAPLARTGITGTLSRQNAGRNPRRTASTASALMIGLALVGAVATVGASAQVSVGRIIDRSIKAGYIVDCSSCSSFTTDVATRLRTVPGAVVTGLKGGETAVFHDSEGSHDLTGVDAATVAQTLDVTLLSGDPANLAKGQIFLVEDVAENRHLAVGDTMTLGFERTGNQPFVVGGVYAQNEFLGSYVLDSTTLQANVGPLSDFLVFVSVPASVTKATLDQAVSGVAGVTVKDQSTFAADTRKNVSQVLNLVYGLLALSILIAVIGVVNTLALSVIERTREIGLIRAVGMGRRQVWGMVTGESVIVSIIGALLGMGLGVVFGISLVEGIGGSFFSALAIPWGTLVVVLTAAAVAGVLAALWPARRAAKLDVLRAIATS